MANIGRSDFTRVLDELVCDATPVVSPVVAGTPSIGINADANRVVRVVGTDAAERAAQLRSLTTRELLNYLPGGNLSREELLLIHEIAAERLNSDAASREEAIALSRAAMQAAVNKQR